VHRLDKDTTGLMVLAKTDLAYHGLVKRFSSRQVYKVYTALVRDIPSCAHGSCRGAIGRHPRHRTRMAVLNSATGARAAHTDWSILQSWPAGWALLKCVLHTGRTHQIRVHCAHMGHPLAGDSTYGFRSRKGDPITPEAPLLHSTELAFEHPVSQAPVALQAPLPGAFQQALDTLKQETQPTA
jgi:23S rRNA pseudouridine1911/1915/1917 synthase